MSDPLRLVPPEMQERYGLPPGEWWLAPAALSFTEARRWAREHGFDEIAYLSSSDTAGRSTR